MAFYTSRMKKIVKLAAVAGLGYWLYRKVTGQQAEAALWNEATDGAAGESSDVFGPEDDEAEPVLTQHDSSTAKHD